MSESKRKSSFEEQLGMISNGQTKTASVKPKAGEDLLSKLARELGVTKTAEEAPAGGAIPLANIVVASEATPVAANPAVLSAMDAVIVPQTELKGGNEAVAVAGEQPAGLQVAATPVIGDGATIATVAQNLNKTPEAVAAAAVGGGGAESANTEKEAEKVGQIIAKSFQDTLEKQAEYQQYGEALNILNANKLLDGYTIKDQPQMAKTASVGCLEKIAAKQPLTRQDIIGAAAELIDLEKNAAAAEEQGRQDARSLVALIESITKTAEEAKEETAEEKKAREDEAKAEGETAASEKAEGEKVAALMGNKEVVAAVSILKKYQLL